MHGASWLLPLGHLTGHVTSLNLGCPLTSYAKWVISRCHWGRRPYCMPSPAGDFSTLSRLSGAQCCSECNLKWLSTQGMMGGRRGNGSSAYQNSRLRNTLFYKETSQPGISRNIYEQEKDERSVQIASRIQKI